ncbi:hypothetical protein PoMZ_05987 [Pyricularia oryzae]|uniref:Uncharacterized protein n=1 Tax=Pyricularia oryzae TaxID=318829 RepID=A0A4P7NQ33_PYROR|nr:hypothetical protein PoMZ_05987 [Pyricularia oryzae]
MSAPIGEKIQPPETAHSSTGYPTPDQFDIMLNDAKIEEAFVILPCLYYKPAYFAKDTKSLTGENDWNEAAETMIRLLMLPDLRYFHR